MNEALASLQPLWLAAWAVAFTVFVSFADSFSQRVIEAYYARTRKTITNKWKHILRSRSQCDSCQTTIPLLHLVPVFGYLAASGRCRACDVRLPLRYPIEEAVAAAYGMVAAAMQPTGSAIYFTALFFVLCYIAARIDWEYYLIPTEVILVMLVASAGELYFSQTAGVQDEEMILRLLIPFLWFFFLHAIRILSRYQLGLADVRLTLALGLALAYPHALYFPTAAALLGIALYLAARGTKIGTWSDRGMKTRIPFGVFLALAFLILRVF